MAAFLCEEVMPLPKPKEDEDRDEFFDRCMGDENAVDEFPDEEIRGGYCATAWEDREKSMSNHLKTVDRTDEELRVANYMVLFDGEDLEGERFTKETEFESSYTKTNVVPVDWEHGLEPDGGPGRDDVLGKVDWKTANKDENGLWVERVLDRRAQYMEYIESLIEEGLIGTSSEATKNAEVGEDGTIKRWPVKRDALTVMPAEPRMLSENAVQAIKALSDRFPNLKSYLPEDAEGVSADETETEEVDKQPTQVKVKETKDMTEETKDVSQEQEESLDYGQILEGMKTQSEQIKGLSETVNTVIEKMREEPANRDAGVYSEAGGTKDKDAKSFGDFLLAVKRNDKGRLHKVYKAMGEDSGSAGGYVVPEEFHNRLMMAASDQSVIRPRATVIPVNSDAGKIPALDQYNSPTAGAGQTALAGGIVGGWAGEGSAGSSTDAAFKQVEYNVKKIAAYTEVSNELIEDSAQSIDSLLSRLFGMAVSSLEEMAFIRGSGAGAPLGVLNADAAIGVSASTSDAWALEDAVNMLSKFKSVGGSPIWIMHREILPDLSSYFDVNTGGVDFIQPREGVPMSLLGYPILFSEHIPQSDQSGMPILLDPSAYVIFDRSNTSVAFSEHAGFTSDQGTWRVTKRLDGQPWLTSSFELADPQGSYNVSPIVYNDN